MSDEILDAANQSEGDTKEGIYFGPEIAQDDPDAALPLHGPNQWPDSVRSARPHWRPPIGKAASMATVGLLGMTMSTQTVRGIACL